MMAAASSGTGNLHWCARICYGVGHFLNDLSSSMWFTYLLVYFHFVLNFSSKMAGYILLVGQIADAVSTPLVGFEIDRWKTGICGYGKRKSWLLIGNVCVVFSIPFIFNKCLGYLQLCDPSSAAGLSNCWGQFIYYVPFVILFKFGWAAVQVSHLSLIPELTFNGQERVGLTSLRNVFTVIAGVSVYAIAWALLSANPTTPGAQCASCLMNTTQSQQITPDDAPVFQKLVFTVVAIGIVFQLVFHCGTTEKNYSNSKTYSAIKTDGMKVTPQKYSNAHNSHQVMTWKDWFKEPQFYQIGLLYMLTSLVVNLSQVYIAMFLTETLHLAKHYIAIIPLVVFMSGFIISWVLKPLNALFGRKLTYVIGATLIILCSLWNWFLSVYNQPLQVFGSAILLGFGNSILPVNVLSITNDLIGKQTVCINIIDKLIIIYLGFISLSGTFTLGERYHLTSTIMQHQNSGAFVLGSMSFTDKISNGLAVMAIQYLHPCQSPSGCPNISEAFYRKTMVFVPGVITIAALIVLLSLAPVTIGKLHRFQKFPGYYEDVYGSMQTGGNCFRLCCKQCIKPTDENEQLKSDKYDYGALSYIPSNNVDSSAKIDSLSINQK